MSRKDDLLKYAKGKVDDVVVVKVVDKVIFLESELDRLENIVKTCIKENAPAKKQFAYSKEFRSTLAQYNSLIRTYNHLCGGTEEVEEDSPLRAWARKNAIERK